MAKKQYIDVSFDFSIWGINSNMEDYRLCLHLNNYLNWQLRRVHDIEFYSSKIKEFKHFNAYKHQLLLKIPAVQSCISIDVNSLKSKHNLLIRHFNEHSKKKNQNSSYHWAS